MNWRDLQLWASGALPGYLVVSGHVYPVTADIYCHIPLPPGAEFRLDAANAERVADRQRMRMAGAS